MADMKTLIGWEMVCVIGLAVTALVALVLAWRATGPK